MSITAPAPISASTATLPNPPRSHFLFAVPPSLAPAPWARASPPTWPTPASRAAARSWFPKARRAAKNKLALAALDALGKSKPAAFYEPALARSASRPGNFEDDLPKLAAVRLGHRGRCRKSRHQDCAAGAASFRTSGRARCSPPIHPACRSSRSPRARLTRQRRRSDSSARTSSIRRATCSCLKSFPRPRPIRRCSRRLPRSPIAFSASRWCSPTTRRTSSPTASASPSCLPQPR